MPRDTSHGSRVLKRPRGPMSPFVDVDVDDEYVRKVHHMPRHIMAEPNQEESQSAHTRRRGRGQLQPPYDVFESNTERRRQGSRSFMVLHITGKQ